MNRARVRWLLALASVALVGGAAAVYAVVFQHRLSSDALENVPAGAPVVLTARPAALLDSELLRALTAVGLGGGGMKAVEQACGSNPLRAFDRITVFVGPEANADPKAPEAKLGDVVYLAEGDIDREQLTRCVRTVLEGDGSALLREDLDGFPAVKGARGDSRALFYGRRAIVGGSAAGIRGVLAVREGRESALGPDDVLIAPVTRRPDGESSAHDLVIHVRVPGRWNAVLRAALEKHAPPAFRELSQVSAVGLGLAVRHGVTLDAALRFENAGQAGAAEAALKGAVDRLRADRALSVSALAPVAASFEVVSRVGSTLRLRLSAPPGTLEPAARLLLERFKPTGE